MPEVLVLNPLPKRRRRKASGAKRRTRRVHRVRAANPAPRRHRRRARRSNPVATVRRTVSRRVSRRRSRNPISLRGFNMRGITAMLKSAAIGGAGAVAVDMVMDKLNSALPASMQPDPTATVSINDVVKAGVTILAGHFLSKPTKGLSDRMAAGALTVQAYRVVQAVSAQYMPGMNGMGYSSPNRIVRGTGRVGPINRMGAFLPAGAQSPVLGRFMAPGSQSPVLGTMSGADRVRAREGILTR